VFDDDFAASGARKALDFATDLVGACRSHGCRFASSIGIS
jgi:hypothetical protein